MEPIPLSLKDIASWSPNVRNDAKPKIIASVPTLQRGLVWDAQQIELLWDSILRGFPIGVFVVCPKIKKQERELADRGNRHLLDGQQRANAIALAFMDPFLSREEGEAQTDSAILWLDLDPSVQSKSTRRFLLRVTTKAHPWGYDATDEAKPLPVSKIRRSLKEIGRNPADESYERPLPIELSPNEATTPVPLAWVLESWNETDSALWDRLAKRTQDVVAWWHAQTDLPALFPEHWLNKVRRFCEQGAETRKARIANAIKRAFEFRLILLDSPQDLMEVSEQEKTVEEGDDGATNIEQIFQRLNSQGTTLEGEELAYSMIKAYWPEIATPIDEISKQRMAPARMVSIGIRASEAQKMDKGHALPDAPRVSEIRQIVMGRKKTKRDLHDFIDNRLHDACELVDTWLRYKPEENETGLLPVLVTSIARDSRDVYSLLLSFAARMSADGRDLGVQNGWRKRMQALATVLHWFSDDKRKATNWVFRCCGSKPTTQTLRLGLQKAIKDGALHQVASPRALKLFLRFGNVPLKYWKIENLIGDDEEKKARWKGFLEKLWKETELVIHCQRPFLSCKRFNYDPARIDIWKDSHQPWDFDHILASAYIDATRNTNQRAPFRNFSSEWASSIGNLRAWPFEDNRSDQKQLASEKIDTSAKAQSSFLSKDQLDGLSADSTVCRNRKVALNFGNACRERLLRIYSHWYESMDVEKLMTL